MSHSSQRGGGKAPTTSSPEFSIEVKKKKKQLSNNARREAIFLKHKQDEKASYEQIRSERWSVEIIIKRGSSKYSTYSCKEETWRYTGHCEIHAYVVKKRT